MKKWINKNLILFFATIILVLTVSLILIIILAPIILTPFLLKLWGILYALSSVLLTFAFARTIKESSTKKPDYIRLFGLIIINITIISFTISIFITIHNTHPLGDSDISVLATMSILGTIATLGIWIIYLTELITKSNPQQTFAFLISNQQPKIDLLSQQQKITLLINRQEQQIAFLGISILLFFICNTIIGMILSIVYISTFLFVWGLFKQAELNKNEKLTAELNENEKLTNEQ